MAKRNILAGIACLVIGPIVIAYGAPNLIDATRSSGWPSVDGRVIASDVVGTGGRTGSTGYRPRVVYRYDVNGQTIEADRISHGDEVAKTRQHATQIAGRYPVDATVPVFYDPNDPASAVLKTGFGVESLVLPGFGAALFVTGGLFIGLALRRR